MALDWEEVVSIIIVTLPMHSQSKKRINSLVRIVMNVVQIIVSQACVLPFVSGDVTDVLLELRRGAILQGRVLGLEPDELGSLSLVAFSQDNMNRGRVDFSASDPFVHLPEGRTFALVGDEQGVVQRRVARPSGLRGVPVTLVATLTSTTVPGTWTSTLTLPLLEL